MAASEPMQVADGVHRVRDGKVNWYILSEGDEVALVDTGWPRSWPRIEAALRTLGRTPADISAILLTHAHPDHVGGAEAARKASGAPVRVHADEVARATGELRGGSPWALVPHLVPQLWRPAAFGFVVHATLEGFLAPTWVAETSAFADDERLEAPCSPTVVATPGHTEGHVAFHLADRGVVLTGDALFTYDPLTGKHGPCLPPKALNAQQERVVPSARRLGELSGDVVLPGHGDPHRGGVAQAVERALA